MLKPQANLVAQPMIVLTPEQLTDQIEQAVERRLAERRGQEPSVYMDPAEVAELLKVKRSSIKNLVTCEGLPCHRLGPRVLRFHRDDVLQWMRERSMRPRAHMNKHLATVSRIENHRQQ